MKFSETIPIIVLNWNGIQDTLECMESIFQQSYKDFIVYLVDNGSKGEEVNSLKAKFGDNEKVKLVLNPENLGFTRGNNEVLKSLIKNEYKYIYLLNNDTAIDSKCLENMLKSAKKNSADIITCKMINYFDPSQMDNAGHQMLNTAEIVPIGHLQPIEEYNKVFENFGSCAGATLYSTQMLREIGIFDEYFETGYEDAELGARAVVLGYKSIFEPTAIVYHKMSQSVNKIRSFEYLQKIQINIFYTYFKLMPMPVLLLNLPTFLFKYGIVLLIDIIFLRIQFLKLLCKSIYRALTTERPIISQSRKAFFQKHRPRSSWEIQKRFTFFLWFDIQRFFKLILKNKKTYFEKY